MQCKAIWICGCFPRKTCQIPPPCPNTTSCCVICTLFVMATGKVCEIWWELWRGEFFSQTCSTLEQCFWNTGDVVPNIQAKRLTKALLSVRKPLLKTWPMNIAAQFTRAREKAQVSVSSTKKWHHLPYPSNTHVLSPSTSLWRHVPSHRHSKPYIWISLELLPKTRK